MAKCRFQLLSLIILYVTCYMDLGLSSTLNVRIVYLDIMRPFAESALQG